MGIKSKYNSIKFQKKIKFAKQIQEINEFSFNYFNPPKEQQVLLSGYFQHWKYIDYCWEKIGIELKNFLENIETSFQKASEPRILIHIRRGDLAKKDNFHTMGILDYRYYAEALHKLDPSKSLKVHAFTDDFNATRDILERINIEDIFGPKDLGSLETFKILSNAKFLVCANSTFSWWAGINVIKSGGRVIIPDPWFRDWQTPINDAFHFPGFEIVISTFLETINFESKFNK